MPTFEREYDMSEIVYIIDIVRKTYNDFEIAIPPSSSIGKSIKSTEDLINGANPFVISEGDCKKRLNLKVRGVLECIWLGEILKGERKNKKIRTQLKSLLKDCLDPSLRTRSRAKDALFELEVFESIKATGLKADLLEPDIVLEFANRDISIACKYIYSEKNLQKQFKRARDQIIKHENLGIVALNISAIISHSSFINTETQSDYETAISSAARVFLDKYTEDFRKWLSKCEGDSIVIGVFVVINTFSRWKDKGRLSVGTQISIRNLCHQSHPNMVVFCNISEKISRRIS